MAISNGGVTLLLASELGASSCALVETVDEHRVGDSPVAGTLWLLAWANGHPLE
jgi:hypothetical protein